MRVAFALLLLIVAGGMAYIRLAPSDPARWHVDPGYAIEFGGLTTFPPGRDSVVPVEGGAHAMITLFETSSAEALSELDAIAVASPRTRRLAGTPEEGRMTWITRSAIFGFPDYTTAEVRPLGPMVNIDIYARLRFGRSDRGVNAARLRDWLEKLTVR
ncbi:MAG: DUF1499 domain-containing protein [Rhodobacteraceae bacterium]|nr:DUF1499 domain-containing protein [Paracoccaceae bacterium]